MLSLGPGASLGVAALLLAVPAVARAEESAFHVAPDPALTRLPRLGELTLRTGQLAVEEPGGPWTGAWFAGMAWGIPAIGGLRPMQLRLELPLLERRMGLQGGSTTATLSMTLTLAHVGPFSVQVPIEVGALAPSFTGATVEALGRPLAVHDLAGYLGISGAVRLRAIGLAVVAWTQSYDPFGAALDWGSPSGALRLRAGGAPALGNRPARWLGGVGVVVGPGVELGVGASAALDLSRAALIDLSLHWSPSTESTRAVPWEGADARVLHADEVRGREPESFGVPGKYTVIELGADWCPPCRQARPVLERLARRPHVAVRVIDVDECPEVFDHQRVHAVPTFIVLDPHGMVLGRQYGGAWVLEDLLPR
jgi:thiol-disulfide isomerase/thioredoxin